jgi:hypothetical protein
MIQIKPHINQNLKCSCGNNLIKSELLWQGLHVCEKFVCSQCNKIRLNSLPVNQSGIEQYSYYPDSDLVFDIHGRVVPDNWFSKKLKSIENPISEIVNIQIEVLKQTDEVLILNTLDYVYGHSLLYLLNLQRILKLEDKLGIIVLVQPMLKWLIPKQGIAEIWTVNLGFNKLHNYYPDLSNKINSELTRFKKVLLSNGYVLPTNENIDIEKFTGLKTYNFSNKPIKPRITLMWREDPDRLWIRNIYILKGFKKLHLSWILTIFQYLRVLMFFRVLRKKLGPEYQYTVTGLGKSGKFSSFINDQRIKSFNDISELQICKVYSESIIVIGVHGSGMLLPSAHAGMTISLMPSKRWGNFAEDILFSENDLRLAAFQKRIVPLNLCIYDVCDIATDMIEGRDYFVKKFIHGAGL